MKQFEELVEELENKQIYLLRINSIDDVLELKDYKPYQLIMIIDKELEDKLNELGYHNIVNVENVYDLTDEELNGLNSLVEILNSVTPEVYYSFNHSNWLQHKMREDGNLKNASLILKDLLYSINANDSEKFKTVVKYSLDSLIQSNDALQNALLTIDNDMLWECKYNRILIEIEKLQVLLNQRDDAISKLNKQIEVLGEYKTKYAEFMKVSLELEEAEKSNADLVKELNSLRVSMQDMISKQEVLDLTASKKALEEKLSDAKRQIEHLQSNQTPVSDYSEEITLLKEALLEAQNQSKNEVTEASLPVITEQMYLNTKKLVLIKEVKPAVYFDSILIWINKFIIKANSPDTDNKYKNTICIVYDKLDNYYRTKKYTKHNFEINTTPLNGVVITNNLTDTFLVNTLKIQNYDCIFIIDRLGFKTNVIKRPDVIDYYLIDSPSDITDFKLKPEKCITFYERTDGVGYSIVPNASLGEAGSRKRLIAIYNNNFMRDVIVK